MTASAEPLLVDQPIGAAPTRRWPKVALLGGAGVLAWLLVRRVEGWAFSPGTLLSASPEWVLACAAATVGTYAASAIAMAGATTVRLGPADTVGIQFAATMTNRFVPSGAAGMAMRGRFIERSGGTRAQAVASLAMLSTAGLAVRVVAFVACATLFWHSPVVARMRFSPTAVAVVIASFAAGGLVLVFIRESRLAHRVRRATASMRREFRALLRDRRRLPIVLGGSAGVLLSHALALTAATRAVGLHVAMPAVILAYIAAAAAAAMSPLPSGLGALDLTLAAALTTGGADGRVVAAVLLYRLITFWLPFAPGYLAVRSMRRRGLL